MWELWACIINVWCMFAQVSGQCFKSKEVGGILTDATRLNKQIDIEGIRMEILLRGFELVENIPHCKTITTADGQIPLCLVKNLVSCLNYGGELAPDQLELYNSVGQEWQKYIFPSDMIMTNDFCYLTINSKPIINKKQTCIALTDTIKDAIGLEKSYSNHRLIIKDNTLMGAKDDIPGQALCQQTPYLMAQKQSDLILLNKLGQAYDKTSEIIKMVGLALSTSNCGEINFGLFTQEQISCLKEEFKEQQTRRKRSTLLNLLLGDGARTDSIQNKVHDMTSIINDNSLKLYKNQEQLRIVGLSNGNSITELEKRTAFSESVTLASIHHIEKMMQRQTQNELSMISNNGLTEEITQVTNELQLFGTILGEVLLGKHQYCTSLNPDYGCLQLNESYIRVRGPQISLDLKIRFLEKKDFFLISCQPRMQDSSISIFHNNHAKVQTSHLQISEYLIKEENLKLDREEHRSLNEDDFYLNNIIFTFDENRIGMTCRDPELLFTSGNNKRFNCTSVISWLSLSEGLEVHSVRGTVTHAETRQPHLNKKSQFLQNYEKLDGNLDNLEIIRNTTKLTSFHKIWLNQLKELTPFEAAAISLGSGSAILIILLALICIWKIKFQCFQCCRTHDSGLPNTTERNHPTREEVFQRSQSILEGYLDRLRRGSNARAQPAQ